MNLISIPAFQDNYIWVLSEENGRCLIVDPGEAAPVLAAIETNHWQPEAILLTHHHHDHVGGVKQLREKFPALVVYGPAETQDKGTTHLVAMAIGVNFGSRIFYFLYARSHFRTYLLLQRTLSFCGDTMFSGGCGRLFEGTAEQMYQSFRKINALPEDTLMLRT
jgi:hydroxyacylglutathione hydrolase